MASVALKSTAITNLDATPVVKVNNQLAGGVVREAVGLITTNSDDSIGSTYRFCRIPGRARISEILGYADVGSAGAGIGDIGVYQTAANGGAVVDADFFASAWDFSNADANSVALEHEAGAGHLVNEIEQPLWQALEVAANPDLDYDIVMTLTEAVTTGAAEIGLRVRYVLPE